MSFTSLHEAASEPVNVSGGGGNTMHRISSVAQIGVEKPQRTSVGKAEYIGLTLPVDISMLFQVGFCRS